VYREALVGLFCTLAGSARPLLRYRAMYVRWINRPRKKQGRPTVHWAAVLVENKWIDGRPVQQHVAYLGGITQAEAKRGAEQRSQFWDKATAQLDALRMPKGERRKIEATLAARVPRPTTAELRRHQRTQQQERREESPRILALQDERLALQDEMHDLDIEEEEERERA
jgi:hypothetical protein